MRLLYIEVVCVNCHFAEAASQTQGKLSHSKEVDMTYTSSVPKTEFTKRIENVQNVILKCVI